MCITGEARTIREKANLSQAEISLDVGADPSAIGRWERGERLPRGEVALRYLRLLEKVRRAVAA